MKLDYIKSILQNRLRNLLDAKTMAFNSGDMEQLVKLDEDIMSTQISLVQICNIDED